MARVIGTVKSIYGKAAVKTADGQLKILKVGDTLHENEMVYALGADSTVNLDLEGGRTLHLNGYDEILLDSSVFTALDKGESLDVDALRQAIADGLDPSKEGETAAGNEVVSESNAGADFAVRNDGRGDVNSYLTGTESSALGVTLEPDSLQAQNIAPIALDDAGMAIEEGSGEDYDAPVVAAGNVLENDTDDQAPTPSDLDVTAITSNDTVNAATLADGHFSIIGKYGTLVINGETGAYTYTVDEGNHEVDALNVGDSVTESFNYTVSDGLLTDVGLLTLTINGSNDAPVAVSDYGYATESGFNQESVSAEGNVITDAQSGDHDVDNTKIWITGVQNVGSEESEDEEYRTQENEETSEGSFVINGQYGVLYMWEDGRYEYILNNENEEVDRLNVEDRLEETFSYTLTDGDKYATATLTIGIEGTNDAPIANADTVEITEDDLRPFFIWHPALTIDAVAGDTDVDSTDLKLVNVSVEGGWANGVAWIDSNTNTIRYVPNWYGNQSLNEGDPKNVTINYTISDDMGATDTSTVTVLITGVNDRPDVYSSIFNVVYEDHRLEGQVYGSDIDAGETETLTYALVSDAPNGLTFREDGTYSFNAENYDYLSKGEHLTLNIPFIAIDENDSISAPANLKITIIGTNDAPTIENTAVVFALSEEGLAGSIPDTLPAGDDTTNTAYAEGSMGFNDVDGGMLRVALYAPAEAMTSGGQSITWKGMGTNTLVGSASDSQVITIHVERDGDYTVTLKGPIDHPLNSVEDTLSFDINVRVTDGKGGSTNANLAITVEDDMPGVSNISATVVEGSAFVSTGKDNVVLVIDRSGSMSGEMDEVRDAVEEMFQSGNVNAVFIVSFDGTASTPNGNWYTNMGSALTAVNALQTGGGTDYDAALSKVMSAYTPPPSGGDRLISIFMSDGEPTEGSGWFGSGAGINGSEESTWINFLTQKGFAESYAIGFGDITASDKTQLEPIAWSSPETAGTYTNGNSDGNIIILENASELKDAIASIVYVPQTVEGVLTTASGADGWLNDGAPIVFASYGGENATFALPTDSHTFDLGNVGSVVIRGDGSYTFTGANADVAHDLSAVVSYTVIDADGDSATGYLTLTATDSSEVGAYDNADIARIVQVTIPGIPTTQTLANFSGNDSTPDGGAYNPWIFDHSGGTESVIDGGSSISLLEINGNFNKWVVTTQTGSSLDVGIENNRLVVQDNNGGSAGSSQLLTPLFAVATNGTTLSFDYERGNVNSSDTVTWQLYKQNGSSWSPMTEAGYTGVLSGITSGEQTVTSNLLNTGNYRIYFSVNDGGGSQNSKLYLDDIRLIVPGADIIQTNITNAVGNVLTDPNTLISSSDAWNAVDDKGSEGAVFSIFNGSDYISVDGTTTVEGVHGTLVINSNGSYVYTPDSNAVGQTETFSYMLTQPDGDSDTADLVIKITDGTYTELTPISGSGVVEGTSADDVILGGNTNDTLNGNTGNDHLEGRDGDDTLNGGDGDDILLGGKGFDTMVGGLGNDTLVIDSEDGIVNGGGGYDTVMLSGSHNIDFSNLANLQITNIEALDLTNGDHTINNITAADVLNITGESNTLQITGDDGDSIGLIESDWMENGSAEIGGVEYNVYSGINDVTINIQDGINIDIIP